jgi:hypothetical protein
MDELDSLISEKEQEARNLRSDLARVTQQLKALRRARTFMRSKTETEAARFSTKGRESIPKLVEQVLRQYGPLHVDLVVRKLAESNVFVSKQSVTSSLVRYLKKNERFERVGRNTFALRGSIEEKEGKDSK